jgi:striatin 1/3/4
MLGVDSSTRLWELNSKQCLQEFTSHRKKFDMSVNEVCFHSKAGGGGVFGGSRFFATCGADGVAKIYQ